MDAVQSDVVPRCRRPGCGRRLGRYQVVEDSEYGGLGFVEPESRLPMELFRALGSPDRPTLALVMPTREGPRTGTGIYFEPFQGRPLRPNTPVFYWRIRCKCGRNEKRRRLDPELRDGTYFV